MDPYESLSIAELQTLVAEKTKIVRFMANECDLIERYLMRMDPNLLIGLEAELMKRTPNRTITFASSPRVSVAEIYDALPPSNRTSVYSTRSSPRTRQSMHGSIKSSSIGLRSSMTSAMSTTNTMQSQRERRSPIVNFRTKVDILERMSGDLKCTTDEYVRRHRPILSNHKAAICEKQMHLSEVRGTVAGLEALLTSPRVCQDDVLAFLHRWLKATAESIERTRLRIMTQRQRHARCVRIITDTAQLKAVFLPVDFVQLEIDRSTNQQLLHERNQQFLSLKNVSAAEKSRLARERKSMLSYASQSTAMQYEYAEVEQKRRLVVGEKSKNVSEIQRIEERLKHLMSKFDRL